MAKLDTPFGFTGKVGLLSFYHVSGSNDIIVRKAKGHSRKRIKTDPQFQRTRENSIEFSARTKLVNGIYRKWIGLKPAFDYNVYNELISRTRAIQMLDKTGGRGERGLPVSEHGRILEGLPFNKKYSLENIISPALETTFELKAGTACISIPRLIPDIQFHNLPQLPFYRFAAILQSIPDIIWKDGRFQEQSSFNFISVSTAWQKTVDPFQGEELNLILPAGFPEPTCLMLSFAVLFGKGNDEAVKYAGAGKILRVEGRKC